MDMLKQLPSTLSDEKPLSMCYVPAAPQPNPSSFHVEAEKRVTRTVGTEDLLFCGGEGPSTHPTPRAMTTR